MSTRLFRKYIYERKKRILILGGGFGGLYTALHLEKTLARDADIQITLVNRENFFLFTPMLHEVAASDLDTTHIVSPARKLLKNVDFFQGDVERIDLPNKTVGVSHGQGREHHEHELRYDYLVLSLGAVNEFFRPSRFSRTRRNDEIPRRRDSSSQPLDCQSRRSRFRLFFRLASAAFNRRRRGRSVRRLQRRNPFLRLAQRFSLGYNVSRLWRQKAELRKVSK